jgi:dTDP-4-amino-4,6-dideoxygalactose transaminase
MKIPAMLGGPRSFPGEVPISQPSLPPAVSLMPDIEKAFASKQLTNGDYVRRLEKDMEEKLNVRHAVALSSCTSGLLLALRALGVKGEVILPSFTFFATAHAVIWNGLTPVFADCEATTFNVDPGSVESLITQKTGAIIGVHVFGNPCRVTALERIANRHGISLLFDSAHGLGACFQGLQVGNFGDAEVFSLSPTKTVVAGEGGVITTRDPWLARILRAARDYGNSGDYDPDIIGLNARMMEVNAILGSASLRSLDQNVTKRCALATQYMKELEGIRGLTFQTVLDGNVSSFKDLGVLIDERLFGVSRDQLQEALRLEGVATKKYFSPPVHRQKAYKRYAPKDARTMATTDFVSSRVLCLPMYAHMEPSSVSKICIAVRSIHECASDVRKCLNASSAGGHQEDGLMEVYVGCEKVTE